MNRLIIMTVGTSLITNDPPIQKADYMDLQKRRVEEKQSYGKMWERLTTQLRKKLTEGDQSSNCAELSTLRALKVTADDHVLLISTDTLDCYACVSVLTEWIKENLSCKVAEPIFIEGLQVGDQKRLEQQGLPNLVGTLLDKIEQSRYSYEVVLSPTGGYKGVVPYLTLVGMMFACPIYYLFEEATELINLPAIPIDFHYEKLASLRDKIKTLESEEGKGWIVPSDKFWSGVSVDYSERQNYAPFLVEYEGLISLSAFGRLLYRRWQDEVSGKIGKVHEVYACDRFIDQWLKTSGDHRKRVDDAIDEFRGGILSTHWHPWHGKGDGSDFLYYKANDPQFVMRISFQEEAAVYRLCRIFFDHNEYERHQDSWSIYKERAWVRIR